MKNQLLFGAIAASAMTMGSLMITTEVQALTLTTGSTTCNVSQFTGTTECEGAYNGNPTPDILPSTELFDEDGWTQITKIDTGSASSYDNGKLAITNTSGNNWTWAFGAGLNLSLYESLFFAVKGGPTFSAYLWDGVTTSGTFNTLGILKGNNQPGPGLSNLSVYARLCQTPGGCGNPDPDPDPVPTPAAVLPILGGLFGAASRRKKGESTEA